MSITIDYSGRTALVTGSSQGIGAETARVLHKPVRGVVLNHPDTAEGKSVPAEPRPCATSCIARGRQRHGPGRRT